MFDGFLHAVNKFWESLLYADVFHLIFGRGRVHVLWVRIFLWALTLLGTGTLLARRWAIGMYCFISGRVNN